VPHKDESGDQREDASKRASYWQEAFGPASLPNWALVIVGVVTGFFAWRRLKRIEDQANSGRDAATAALLSADAVVRNERAWITVLPYIWSPEFYPMWEPGDPIPDDPTKMHPIVHLFQAKVKNVGKTPAKIESVSVRYIRTSSNPIQLNADPDYGKIFPQDGYFLTPQDEILATATLSPEGTMTKAQIAAIRNQDAFSFAYGIVKYRDVYDHPHETRFGYVYRAPRDGLVGADKASFRHGGPPSYSRTT
jgi:hypothetical protein